MGECATSGSFENRTEGRFHIGRHPSAAIFAKQWRVPDFIRQIRPIRSLVQLLHRVDPFTGPADEVIDENEDLHSWRAHLGSAQR